MAQEKSVGHKRATSRKTTRVWERAKCEKKPKGRKRAFREQTPAAPERATGGKATDVRKRAKSQKQPEGLKRAKRHEATERDKRPPLTNLPQAVRIEQGCGGPRRTNDGTRR